MSSSAAKLVALVAVVLTIALALLTYRVSHNYAETAKASVKAETASGQPVVPKTLAVVALRPLAAYKTIAKEDVGLVELSVTPTDFYSNVAQVIGKQPVVDIDGGAPVTKRYFGEGNLLARAIPPGYQAVSVELNDVIAVGNFVRPGDMVDVLVYLRNNQDVKEAQARVLLHQVRVLAYDEMLVERPDGLTEQDKKASAAGDSNRNSAGRRSRTAVLAVPESETTRLMLGSSQGELRLALYGQTPPGTEDAPIPEATVAGGLPASAAALADIASNKVPDKAISMQDLSHIKPPPAKQNQAPIQVPVYRASDVKTVAVKP